MKNTLFLALALLFVPLGLSAQEKITFQSLLEQMTSPQSLAQWQYNKNYRLIQASSYSRESVSPETANEDGLFRPENPEDRDWGKGWFENHDFGVFIREEVNGGRNELVMMEDDGAGAIVRFWATFGGRPDEVGGLYRIYIDGAEEPVITMHNKDLVVNNGLVGEPFAFYAPKETENPTWRGSNLMLPIPYGKSCKVTYEPFEAEGGSDWNGHYYAINYREYNDEVEVESFDKNTLTKYKDALAHHSELLIKKNKPESVFSINENALLPRGGRLTIKLEGERAITKLGCQIKARDIEQALRSTVLEITFDGNKTVWCPLGQFYGIGYRQLNNDTYYVSADSLGMMESRWLMPFSRSAQIRIHNHGEQTVEVVALDIDHKEYGWNENTMYFHAAWNETKNLDTQTKFDYNFITIRGRGVFVGDNLTIFNTFPDRTGINWWGEGDEKIYVDGEDFPSNFGTGTEDYYCYAWCRPQWFSSINVSQPLGEGNKTPGLSVNNRYRLLDAIPFEESFKFDMEIWHPYYAPMNYSPATFWYAFKGARWNYKADVEEVKKPVARLQPTP